MGKLTDDFARPSFSRVDPLQWCDDNNRKEITRKLCRWYFVDDVDGKPTTQALDGVDGENVHKLLDGKLGDFEGWPAARMAGYRKWLRSMAEKGLVRVPA